MLRSFWVCTCGMVLACRSSVDLEKAALVDPPEVRPRAIDGPGSTPSPSRGGLEPDRPGGSDGADAARTREGPEAVGYEWPDKPFEDDLDGDGDAEAISWSCDPFPRVQVNQLSYTDEGDYADLIGCTATTVDLDPTVPGRHVLLIGDEHEEAGPDRHILLEYSPRALRPVWAEYGDVDFFSDGSWRTTSGECDDLDLVYRTTLSTHRLVSGEVQTERRVGETQIEPGDCAEP